MTEDLDDEDGIPENDPVLEEGLSTHSELKNYLESKTKQELVSICLELSKNNPKVEESILDKSAVENRQTQKLLKSVRSEILAMAHTEWDRHGYGGHSADLYRLKEQLQALKKLEEYDELVALGPELLGAGSEAIQYEPESESSDDIRDCLGVTLEALPHTSLSIVGQLTWAVDMEFKDEYGFCDGISPEKLGAMGSKNDWSVLADDLYLRLGKIVKPAAGKDGFSYRYSRDRLSNWIACALKNAGRDREVLKLLVEEAQTTLSYDRLVDCLISLGKWDEAEDHCIEGIRVHQLLPGGYPASLYDRLGTIYEKTGQVAQKAALMADTFFSCPSSDDFFALKKITRRLKQEQETDLWMRYFLETGREPSRQYETAPKAKWPLPPLEAPIQERRFQGQSPHYEVLIDIAIKEKKPDEVLAWYHRGIGKIEGFSKGFSGSEQRVAEAIRGKYPLEAIQIWKGIAQENINLVNVKGYENAAPYIKKIKTEMLKNGMDREWEGYYATLKTDNSRRPRCLDMLNRIGSAEKRIVD